jgi:hypothetical protein
MPPSTEVFFHFQRVANNLTISEVIGSPSEARFVPFRA